MTETESKCLETFPEWLRSLASDAQDLAAAVGKDDAPEALRRYAAAGLNYLFKSLDLIPDGIEDLGYLDDAFVLRVAASRALAEAPDAAQKAPEVARLATDAALIKELLGSDYARLEKYVESLKGGAARGRSVDEILSDEAVRRDFQNEVSGWSTSYEAPSFTKDEKNLVKLKSFLAAKLP
ncbi:MAG: YkvA family protein [Polyangiaceae bacterium]